MRYAAFLRGINVSGQKIIKMELLKALFAAEFDNVVTYIQSGNVLFDTDETDTRIIRKKAEQLICKGVGYEVITIIRSIDEIKSVIELNPFEQQLNDDKRKLYVHFLSDFPPVEKHGLLQPVLTADEEVKVINRDVYFLAPSAGNTKCTNAFMEKKLGVSATARNWATVNKVTVL